MPGPFLPCDNAREDALAMTLADRLRRHAATIPDPALRAGLFRSLAGGATDDDLREAVEALSGLSARGDTHARVALLSLQVALAALPARQRAVFDPRHALESQEGDEAPPEEDQRRVPDYGRGRTLTLGERKSLARRPDRRMLDRVMRDPHPDVIALLLQNPRLTEPDVVRLCSRRPGTPEVLHCVFASARWSLRPAVRRALAMNPATPAAITAAVLPLLGPDDLRALLHDDRTPAAVARRCEELLVLSEVREVAAPADEGDGGEG